MNSNVFTLLLVSRDEIELLVLFLTHLVTLHCMLWV